MSGLTRWLMGSIQHPPQPWLRKKFKVAKDRRDLSVVVNYFSYCTLVLDHTSWVWIIWQRHWSCICVLLCTSGLSHTRLMTPVFLGELWVRLASLKPASFDTWKGAGHSLSRAPQSTVKHSEAQWNQISSPWSHDMTEGCEGEKPATPWLLTWPKLDY